ncbi:MAG: hypothetical protein A2677_00240 [Candidatus Komeilibacteria bacterium RIFCSPHIGHO2_01_FULL_52_14]|uniref:Uncharacterized protein n=1 Tax=Candidatus Komeilibacteria bacterium RIFCSPHIGHO2_01_FULL_52_14 TaxID=1798549 RepID=A0A1G2BNE7_9BACT|nr:MAG: hypothetical protein A2677_00240 [Candidatus Komeilibacteria bacterium RIFCSPHIGHO2_01_FULL_52_14]
MDTKLFELATTFDLSLIAQHLHDRVQKTPLTEDTNLFEAHEYLPELNRITTGYDGQGRMSYRLLARDRDRVAVLAALYDCAAPPHLHREGEDVIDLVGGLKEHEWCAGRVSSGPAGSRHRWSRWGVESFHQPFTSVGKLWVGVYLQPHGLTIFDSMTRTELGKVFQTHAVAAERLMAQHSWHRLSATEARMVVAENLKLRMPPNATEPARELARV